MQINPKSPKKKIGTSDNNVRSVCTMTVSASQAAGRLLVALLLLPFGHCFRTTCPDEPLSLTDYASFFDKQFQDKYLPFWMSRVDRTNGGYDLGDGDKMIVTQIRLVWTFSHAHLNGYTAKQGSFLEAAKHGFDYIMKYFLDPEVGGYYFLLDAQGNPKDTKKHLYSQSFVIYGLSEYYKASQDKRALTAALDLFSILKHKAPDPSGGYFESFHKNWTVNRGSNPTSWDGAKSANALMHYMEALTSLYSASSVWDVRNVIKKIVNIDRAWFFPDDVKKTVFLRGWNGEIVGESPTVAYGHEVEFAYLKLEAEKAIDQPQDFFFHTKYLHNVVKEGMDPTLGALSDFDELVWWAQAEFMSSVSVAKQNGYSGPYESALIKVLRAIQCHMSDDETGVWVWSVYSNGTVRNDILLNRWKGSYHATRGMVKFIKAYGG